MFLKPFRIKTQTAIKGSERKRLRTDFSKNYKCLSEEDLRNLIPNKDEMTVSKIMTHSGQQVIVYSVGSNPILFELDSILYPTVYALWSYPSLVSLKFTTWPPVLEKLQGGADLMLPGVVLPKSEENAHGFALGEFPKHQGCVVDLVRSRCCIAVGMTALSSEDMFMSGMKGKGVIILHTYKDQLWAMGSKSNPPASLFNPGNDDDDEDDDNAELKCFEQNNEETESNPDLQETKPEDENISDSLTDHSIAAGFEELKVCEETLVAVGGTEGESSERNEEVLEGGREKLDIVEGGAMAEDFERTEVSTPQDVDELLEICFLHSLKLYKKKELPILTSTFFRNHILPCCPEGKSLDIKKSTYKKLSKFLAAKQGEGLIKVKELTKGVESIVDIDFDHEKLHSLKIPEVSQTPQAATSGANSSQSNTNISAPQITDLYLATAAVLPLFAEIKIRKGDPFTAAAVRSHVTDYVKANNLQDVNNKGVVHLDPILSDAVLDKGENIEVMKWEDVMQRLLNKMTRAYEITVTGSNPRTELRKGQPEPIRLEVAQRGSNKKVTIVHNLEIYGIDPTEFAALVQKGVACSTSVSEDQSVKRVKGSQVCAQGNQINFIASLLTEKYQIPSKYLDGLQNAPKKKRK